MPPAPSPRSSRSFFGMGMIGQTLAHANGIVNTIERLGSAADAPVIGSLGRPSGAFFVIRSEQVSVLGPWAGDFTWDLSTRQTSGILPKVLMVWTATLTVKVTVVEESDPGSFMQVELPDVNGEGDWSPTNRSEVSLAADGHQMLSVSGASQARIPDALGGFASVDVGPLVNSTIDALLVLQPPAGSI